MKFMLDKKTGCYWRICWFLVTPFILTAIFLYTVATLSPLTYGGREYPTSAHVAGALLLCFSVLQIPYWMILEMLKNRNLPFLQNLKTCFAPSVEWGPAENKYKAAWLLFKEEKAEKRCEKTEPMWRRLIYTLIGKSEEK